MKLIRLFFLLILIVTSFYIESFKHDITLYAAENQGEWSSAGMMKNHAIWIKETLLQNGNVLVTGSENPALGQIYNPLLNTWTSTGAMNQGRETHEATLLSDGKVLITGGSNINISDMDSSELYNPIENTWTTTSDMLTSRHLHTATLLSNGNVLVTGGENFTNPHLRITEEYDYASGTWTSRKDLNIGRNSHKATLLNNGNVLVTGGVGPTGVLNSVEVYDVANNTWNVTGNMHINRLFHSATLLKNGKVLVVGGRKTNSLDTETAELYDPSNGTWSMTGSLHISRELHTATLLPNGKVLIVGGESNINSTTPSTIVSSSEIYDPATGLWQIDSNMSTERRGHTATLLKNGRVLISGGYNFTNLNLNSAELYTPVANPNPTPTPTIPKEGSVVDFKQNRNADGSLVDWAKQTLFDAACPTMGAEGCAITSFTNVIASYQAQSLPNNTSVDPGNVNHFLAQNSGTHSGCGIYFNTAAKVVGYKLLHNDFPLVPLSTRIQHIDEALDAGNLVIAGVGGHFVVLYKKSSTTAFDGSPDYFIADPYRYAPYALGNRTGEVLSKHYKTINQLKDVLRVVVVENKLAKSGMSWVIAGHSPIELLITDPNGLKTGFNPETNSYQQDIPESNYGLEQGLSDDEGLESPQSDYLYYGQENPVEGKYTVQVTGTGTGSYTLDFASATGPGETSLQTIAGTTFAGKTETFEVVRTSNANQSIIINKNVSFQSLINDVNEVNNLNFITQKSFSNSLIRNIEQAQKADQASDLGKVIQNLDQFISILNRERGKKVTEEGYKILLDNVTFLKGKYII